MKKFINKLKNMAIKITGRKKAVPQQTNVQLSTPVMVLTVDSSSQITINWTAVPNGNHYEVQRATDAGFSQNLVTVFTGAGVFHVDTGRTASTTYYYRVRALGHANYITSAFDTESATTQVAADVSTPTISSKTTTSTTTLQIIFSEAVTVTTAGWSFKKNGSALALLSVSGLGSTWNFTVATMANGDTLQVSYDSATGNTTDNAGNELASVTDSAITNNIPASGEVYPAFTDFMVPDDGTAAPGDAYAVTNMSGAPVADTPLFSEYRRTLQGGDNLVATGFNFGNSAHKPKVFGCGVFEDAVFPNNAVSASVADSDKTVFTIPATVTVGDTSAQRHLPVLVWPKNVNGYGKPIMVNKTEVEWMPDIIFNDENGHVFGKNLAYHHAKEAGAPGVPDGQTSHVYIQPAVGGTLTKCITVLATPYHVEFSIPNSISPGDYKIWVHRGRGGQYGWSKPVQFQYKARKTYTSWTRDFIGYYKATTSTATTTGSINAGSNQLTVADATGWEVGMGVFVEGAGREIGTTLSGITIASVNTNSLPYTVTISGGTPSRSGRGRVTVYITPAITNLNKHGFDVDFTSGSNVLTVVNASKTDVDRFTNGLTATVTNAVFTRVGLTARVRVITGNVFTLSYAHNDNNLNAVAAVSNAVVRHENSVPWNRAARQADGTIGSTLTVTAGKFFIGQTIETRAGFKVLGNGREGLNKDNNTPNPNATIFEPHQLFSPYVDSDGTSEFRGMLHGGGDGFWLENVTLQLGACPFYNYGWVVRFNGSESVIKNCDITTGGGATWKDSNNKPWGGVQDKGSMDLQNSSNMRILGNNITGGGISFVDNIHLNNITNYIFRGNHIMGVNDCNATYGGGNRVKLILLENKYYDQNPWKQSDPTKYDFNNGRGWSKGRIVAGGASSSWHFYGREETFWAGTRHREGSWYQDGTNNTTRPLYHGEDPDENSGEGYMFEGGSSRMGNMAVSENADPLKLIVPAFNQSFSNLWSFATIVQGKGVGQTRRILTAATSTITLDEPWEVRPDSTSIVTIHNGIRGVVTWDCTFNGKNYIPQIATHTALVAVQPFGHGYEIVVDHCTVNDYRQGVNNFPDQHPGETWQTPHHWFTVMNTAINGTRQPILHKGMGKHPSVNYPDLIASIYSRVMIGTVVGGGAHISQDLPSSFVSPVISLVVYESSNIVPPATNGAVQHQVSHNIGEI